MPTRILIAEDHQLVRGMLKALLETHADWQVCAEVANGLEAVQKAAELKPDVAILDLAMPQMDGLQAAREIFSAHPDVPILIYTDYTFSPEAKLEVKKHGVREVINKGAAGDQLLSAVEAVLAQQPRAGATATPDPASLPEVNLKRGPEEV